MPMPVVEAAHIINLPLVKTHFIAGSTLALKNMLGLPHPFDRARRGTGTRSRRKYRGDVVVRKTISAGRRPRSPELAPVEVMRP